MSGWTLRERGTLVAAAFLLLGMSLIQMYVDDLPEQRELREATPFEDVPPDEYVMEYVGSILLGGFRALVVDFLWLRMDDLTKEKKWEEMRLVTEAIARLQPRQTEVYAHNGWNMAYNISNLFDSPEEKVKWIRAGLGYLERGMRKNPTHERAHFWYGYVYWHRVPRNEHTLAPENEQRVLEIIEREDRRCTYETAIGHLMKAQRLFDATEDMTAYHVDKYEGLIVDSMYHIAIHRLGHCWARPGIADDPEKWEQVQRQMQDTARYCRYVDNRYQPGTTFWDERIQYIQRLREIFELERHAEGLRRTQGLEAGFPTMWAIASEYKALKSSKNLFRQGAVERRLRGNLFSICEAAYARVEKGEPDPLHEEWGQLIRSCNTRHMMSTDPYAASWAQWGQGLKKIQAALPDEAKAWKFAREGRNQESAAAAAKALAVYDEVIDENGLFEFPLFADRAKRLREMAGK